MSGVKRRTFTLYKHRELYKTYKGKNIHFIWHFNNLNCIFVIYFCIILNFKTIYI